MRRLSRNRSRLGQIGCIFAIVALLGTLSFFLLRSGEGWLMYVVGGGFGLVAALLFLAGIQQIFALRTAETIVEMDGDALTLGGRTTFRVQQHGDSSFESLRVNLVCEEQLRRRKKNWSSEMIENINLFDSGPFDGTLDRTFTFDVPHHLEPTGSELRRRIRWQLEVWGKIRGRADFQHVYQVHVQKP
ncbi:MAG TPA: phage holin family protein [Thermoanaerobaculia bacterium]|nr:phage holin family protein [Thermoanaerobaculia bacterium]